MIKAIILDDGYNSKDVVMKSGKSYECISLVYFLNLLCKRHYSNYEVKTAFLGGIRGEAAVEWFKALRNMNYYMPTVQFREEFENLWESDELVDGIDLY